MMTIEARSLSGGGIAKTAAIAIIVLWRSQQFSTADIADLLTVAEADVARIVSVARSIELEGMTR